MKIIIPAEQLSDRLYDGKYLQADKTEIEFSQGEEFNHSVVIMKVEDLVFSIKTDDLKAALQTINTGVTSGL